MSEHDKELISNLIDSMIKMTSTCNQLSQFINKRMSKKPSITIDFQELIGETNYLCGIFDAMIMFDIPLLPEPESNSIC